MKVPLAQDIISISNLDIVHDPYTKNEFSRYKEYIRPNHPQARINHYNYRIQPNANIPYIYSSRELADLFAEIYCPQAYADYIIIYDNMIERVLTRQSLTKFIAGNMSMYLPSGCLSEMMADCVREITNIAQQHPFEFRYNYLSFNDCILDIMNYSSPIPSLGYPGNSIFRRRRINSCFLFNGNTCPDVDNIMTKILGDNPNSVNLIWQMLATLIFPDPRINKVFLLQVDPDSGVDLIIEVIKYLFDFDRVSHLNTDQLKENGAMATIENKYVNITMDVPDKALSSKTISVIKQIANMVPIDIERRIGGHTPILDHCRLVFKSEFPLTLKEEDPGFTSKVIRIKFPKRELSYITRMDYLNKLILHINYIVYKAYDAFSQMRINGYEFAKDPYSDPCFKYLKAPEDKCSNSITNFINTRCTIRPGCTEDSCFRTHTSVLYKAYCRYCEENGITSFKSSDRAFSRTVYELYGGNLIKSKWREDDRNANGFIGIYPNDFHDKLEYLEKQRLESKKSE